MTPDPLAYFLTWTTYGTHLHGDARGSVDKLHNVYGTPRLAPDEQWESIERESLKHPVVVLDQQMREIVHRVIEDHCRIRKWRLHAPNVRSNHVHVVVTADRYTPELVTDQFKGWATRRLREAGLIGEDRPVWTAGGSTRYIWDSPGFSEAIDYVMNWQGPERFRRVQEE